ncbi:hypothetical protein [Brevibacillus dissolubilis]|uniref:hypothetical protein n=1 Tax=Brevibacillus dissolubilis TaxID=1844116 RepID=UPI001116078E|nr:hypothetical protein [Brevibacillus dissolubilis]
MKSNKITKKTMLAALAAFCMVSWMDMPQTQAFNSTTLTFTESNSMMMGDNDSGVLSSFGSLNETDEVHIYENNLNTTDHDWTGLLMPTSGLTNYYTVEPDQLYPEDPDPNTFK